MQIRVKLMGVLKDKTPEGGALELPDGATIVNALDALEIAADNVPTFFVNNKIQRDKDCELADGDELSILPPVGGG